jgi:hypothetical protein
MGKVTIRKGIKKCLFFLKNGWNFTSNMEKCIHFFFFQDEMWSWFLSFFNFDLHTKGRWFQLELGWNLIIINCCFEYSANAILCKANCLFFLFSCIRPPWSNIYFWDDSWNLHLLSEQYIRTNEEKVKISSFKNICFWILNHQILYVG